MLNYFRGIFLCFLLGTSLVHAAIEIPFEDAKVIFHGAKPNDGAGSNSKYVGDTDNNGQPDLLIGAPQKNIQFGVIYYVENVSFETASINIDAATVSYNGNLQNDFAGNFFSDFGDLDGDSKDDFAYILPGSQKVIVRLGHDINDFVFFNSTNLYTVSNTVPHNLSLNGDINGDGYDDLLIGAKSNTNQGQVFLVLGRSDFNSAKQNGEDFINMDLDTATNVQTVFEGELANDFAGFGAVILPDINGDGFDDILISAYNNTGRSGKKVYLIYGQRNAFEGELSAPNIFPLSQADAIFYSKESQTDGFGEQLLGLGDIDGDGFGDFAIGAHLASNRQGKVYLYYGGPGKPYHRKEATDANSFSASISGVGNLTEMGYHGLSGGFDVTGDGLNDLIIGESQDSSRVILNGQVYIIPGQAKLSGNHSVTSLASHTIYSSQSLAQIGYTTSLAGDVDQDGIYEVLVGSNGYNGLKGAAGIFKLAHNTTPNVSAATLNLYPDATYTTPTTNFALRQWAYVQVQATDPSPNAINSTLLLASSNIFSKPAQITLTDSPNHSGFYRGKVQLVRARNSSKVDQVSATENGRVSFQLKDNLSVFATVNVVNAAPVITTLNLTQVGSSTNTTVLLNYSLVDYDSNNLGAFLTPSDIQYSSDNGSQWNDATLIGVTSNLTTSEEGVPHNTDHQGVFWNAYQDIGLNDGHYQVRMRPHDGKTYARNYIESQTIHIDNIAPTAPTLSQPGSKQAFLVTITGNAEPLATIEIYVGDTFSTSANIPSNGQFTVFPVTVSSTNNVIRGIVVDAAGFRSPTSDAITLTFGATQTQLSDENISITLDFPLNAVTSDAQVIFDRKDPSTLPQNPPTYFSYINAFDLELSHQSNVQFSAPVTASLTLTTPLTSLTGITLNYWIPTQNLWSSKGLSLLSIASTNITFATTHFTQFALSQLIDPTAPTIDDIKINDVPIADALIFKPPFTISTVLYDGDTGVSSWSVQIIDTKTSVVITQNSALGLTTTENLTVEFNPQTLHDGHYNVVFKVWDNSINTTQKTIPFQVNQSSFITSALHAPNPYNPSKGNMTLGLNFSLPADEATFYIYSKRRELIYKHTLTTTEKAAGYHTLYWNGRNTYGSTVPNGLYYGFLISKQGGTIQKIKLKIAVIQ